MYTAVSATLCETDCGFPNGPELRAGPSEYSEALRPPLLRLSTLAKTTVSVRNAQRHAAA